MADQSLFTTQLPDPGKGDESDGGSGLVRGHVLYAAVAGTFTKVRWFSSLTAPPDTPVVALYKPTSDAAGALAYPTASVAYAGAHTGGIWLEQTLPDGGYHTPGLEYVIPTVCQTNRYVFHAGLFNGLSIVNGDLVGIAGGTDPLSAGFNLGNGKLRFGGAGFPNFSPGGSPGYLVDVVFVPDVVAPPTAATVRPSTGSTARPGPSSTTRPFTTTVPRP